MRIYILTTTINTFLATERIINDNEVRGLITLGEDNSRKSNEYFNYKDLCKEKCIDYIEVEDYSLKHERELLESLNIDLLIVVGWQRLIPEWLIDCCHIGAIGGHGSPWGIQEGRGRSPQNWAILLGEKQFEMSIFWIDKGADSGLIIDTSVYSLNDPDDIDVSYIKYSYEFARLVNRNLRNGKIASKSGDEQNRESFYLPKRTMEDGAIDWNRPCKKIYDFIRALSKPYPGAFSKYKDGYLIIWDARYFECVKEDNTENGKIISVLPNRELLVSCLDGYIIIRQYEIKGEISLCAGDILESVDFGEQMRIIIDRHNESGGGALNHNILKDIDAKK